jgi:hypothetical protein
MSEPGASATGPARVTTSANRRFWTTDLFRQDPSLTLRALTFSALRLRNPSLAALGYKSWRREALQRGNQKRPITITSTCTSASTWT